ncbi:MAG TPA: hypothetical protein VNH83_28150, partial [Bryobacteraceae bacterium]|nr:hypothetical protein [Bryobacteraceae bacterium]
VPVSKFGGLATAYANESLPSGVSPALRNVRFTLNTVATRYGLRWQYPGGFQLPDQQRVTGLSVLVQSQGTTVYIPIAFSSAGNLYIESPTGSGQLLDLFSTLFTLPANAYKQDTLVAGREYMVFGDGLVGVGTNATYDGSFLDPMTQWPVGGTWLPNTPYLEGDCVTPAIGNNRLYRAQNSGVTGAVEPVFPTGQGSTVVDNPGPSQITWVENTPEVFNCLSANWYDLTDIVVHVGFGTPPGIPAGLDIYAVITLVQNGGGVGTPSPIQLIVENTPILPSIDVNTLEFNHGVGVDWQLGLPAELQPSKYNVYIATVPTGAAPPALADFHFQFQLPNLATGFNMQSIGNTGGPPPAPSAWITGPGTVPSIGSRFFTVLNTNRAGNISGFSGPTLAAVFAVNPLAPDRDIQIRNLPIGPSNVLNRIVAFTPAGQVSAGPFYYIGETSFVNGTLISSTIVPGNTDDGNGAVPITFNFTDEALQEADVTNFTRKIRLPPQLNIRYSKITDRLLACGEAGQPTLLRCSEPGDYGTFYGDTGFQYFGKDDGQRVWGSLDWKNTVYVLKERGGWVALNIAGNDPINWVPQQRWDKVGPCGARAFDSCPDFIAFAHRSGAYIYTGTGTPVWISKEISTQAQGSPVSPNATENMETWDGINWAYGHLISVTIDYETQRIFFSVPYGNSTLPNITFTCNFARGIDEPVHYGAIAGSDVASPARKWSIDDYAVHSILRAERPLTSLNPNLPIDPRLATTQLMFASSDTDGVVNIEVPDVYDDNGIGINDFYECASHQGPGSVNRFGGCSLGIKGNGKVQVSYVPFNETPVQMGNPLDLVLNPKNTYRKQTKTLGLQFGVRIGTGGQSPGAWWEMWDLKLFMKDLYPANTKADPGNSGE